jgi:hypothetical protein
MDKTILKGILSFLIGGIVFGFLFLWQKDLGLMANFFFSISAGILGYTVISPFILSDDERKHFESKVDKWLDDSEKRKVEVYELTGAYVKDEMAAAIPFSYCAEVQVKLRKEHFLFK